MTSAVIPRDLSSSEVMDVFAVRTYFNAHVLSFFETVLHIHPRQTMTAQQIEQEKEQKLQKLQRKQQQRQRQQEHLQQRRRKMQQQWQRQLTASGSIKPQEGGSGGDPKDGDTKEDIDVSGDGIGGRGLRGVNGGGGRDGSCGNDNSSNGDLDDDDDNDYDTDGEGSGAESDTPQGTRKRGGGKKKRGGSTTASEYDFGDSAANEGRCQFAQLRVAASFTGKTYGYLVRHLISKGAVPLVMIFMFRK